jgi:hypothetical protein
VRPTIFAGAAAVPWFLRPKFPERWKSVGGFGLLRVTRSSKMLNLNSSIMPAVTASSVSMEPTWIPPPARVFVLVYFERPSKVQALSPESAGVLLVRNEVFFGAG